MSPVVLIVWSFIKAAGSVIWPLVGVLFGALLTGWWQRTQWVRDNRKAEYRELISCLRECAHDIANNSGSSGVGKLNSGEELPDIDGPESRGYNLISDRLFIADVMDREKVRERWLAVVKQQADHSKFWAEWSTLYKILLKTARRDLKLPCHSRAVNTELE
jgi:hypothetical protein